MSLDATRWAWTQTVKPTMKLILLSLADRANETHGCYPSVSRLAQDTCLNRKTILSGIKKLAEIRIISIRKQAGKGNFYQLIGVECRTSSGTKNSTSPQNDTSTESDTGTHPKIGTTPIPKKGHESTNNLPMEPTKKIRSKIPPEQEWVENYIIENNYPFPANEFMDVYQARGWKVGREKMKDWEAAIRNFARNHEKWNPVSNQTQPRRTFPE
jgi:hypothetical protein